MKRFFFTLPQGFLALLAAIILMPSPFAKAAAGLNLPPIPNNEADGFVRQTFGTAPFYDGIAPENSWFTVDIQPAGGPAASPTPPIPAGRYAMWCMDSATNISPGGPGFSIPGTLYGGRLYSTSDPLVGFNAFLPNHPSVIHTAATWKKVNYLINHRLVACNGAIPRMWEVETALLILLGQETLASMPGAAQGYPPFRAEVVQCLVDAANTQAAAWEPVCGDKVAVIFNIDINWDNVAPEVQLLILEVPIPCTSLGDFVWNDTNGNGRQDVGEPGISGVTVELYRCADNLKMATTTTDANGKYLFSGLVPGDYYVKVLAPSGYVFTTPNAAGTTTDNDSDAGPGGVMPCTTLTAGENDLSWDAGLLQVPILLRSNIMSCSQVVTYGPELFSSPFGPIVSATFNPASGSTFPFGSSTVNFSATDSAGNTRTGTFTVTIIDVDAPVITPVANITRPNDPGKCTAKVEYTTTAADCNLQSLTFSPVSGTEFPLGTTTVTITATDKVGTTSTSTFTVTVNDTEAPVFTSVPANMTVNNDAGQCYATVTYAATATDCTPVTLTYSPASGSHFAAGTTSTVTVTAKDAAGNITTSTFTVTVKDMEAPVFTFVPANMTVNNDAGQCYATVTYAATATDCSAVTFTYSPVSGSHFTVGTTSTVTVTAKDAAGNISTSTFTVTVKDTEAPVFTSVPANMTVNNDAGQCYATVTYAATATDCTAVTLTYSPASGSHFTAGTTSTVTVTAKDVDGNTSTSTFTVTVKDTEAPVFTLVPPNIVVNNDAGQCYATVNYTATATDCSAVTMTYSPASGSTFAVGTTTTVTVTAKDAAGNTSTSTFTVTVKDTEAPVFTSVPANMTVNNDAGQCYATVTYAAVATDCSAVTLTYSPASGSTFAVGTTSTVTVTAKDAAGNTSTSTFTVTVKDTTAPVIAPMANITKQADAGLCSAVVTFTATATDCSPVTVTTSPASGTAFAVGTTTVTVTAKDSAGNTSTSTFTVTVTDTQAPTITSPTVNLSLPVDTGKCYATFNYLATATDNCAGALTITVSPASGSQFAAGTTTTVTVRATDSAGNVTIKTFTVTVAQCLGSLGNFVWNDVNKNGVQDVGEPGINGVKVTLFTAAGAQVGSPTTTTGGGFYLFSDLPAGTYYVIFDKTTLPAGFVFTSQNVGSNDAADSDANPTTGKSEGNATVIGGQFNDSVDAGAYLQQPPSMTLNKTASPTNAAPYQTVTYSYTVTNTGGTTLTNIVVKDDNGTPSYAGDDFVVGTIATLATGASVTLTAQVIPVVSTTAVVNGNTVPAGTMIVTVLPNGDLKATYRQHFNINDNTYGTGQIGWPGGNKTFSQLVGSDKLEFRFLDKNKNVVIDFYVDCITAGSSVTVPGTGQVISYPSGYGTKGPFGGDGSMVAGNANNIVTFSTSISDNLNNPANLSNTSSLIVNSPTSLVGGNVTIDPLKAPGGWDPINSYTVVIKGSAFGAVGFGSVSVPDQHNSPSKLGVNQITTTTCGSTVTNTAVATSGTLSATDTATVTIGTVVTGPTGSIGSLVWNDLDGDGLQDAGEPGIAGVTVQLKNSSGVVIATDITDGGGTYQFDGLSAGTYTVVVATPSGFSASPKTAGTDRNIDSNGSPATVTLATNSSVDLTVDFGFKPAVTCSKPLLTYTQGGWGAQPKGNNPGALLTKYFSAVYPGGYVGVGTTSRYLAFTSASSVIAFLPQGGTAGTLSASATNPTTSSAGVLAGQLLALRLSVDFSAAGKTATGLGGKKLVSGPLAGKTVNEVLTIANSVIAGGALPTGLTLAGLNDVLTAINENYDNGTTNNGYLN